MSAQPDYSSSGFYDVPPPKWMSNNKRLSAKWCDILVNLILHGRVYELAKGEQLPLEKGEIALAVSGGLYLCQGAPNGENRSILIDLFHRGELLTVDLVEDLQLAVYAQQNRSIALVVTKAAYEEFVASCPQWVTIEPILRTQLTRTYAKALSAVQGRDIDKIRRVLKVITTHPCTAKTELGFEIEAGKKLIRDLAGVQKRSASRAFTALQKEGSVYFYGYKRIFYKP